MRHLLDDVMKVQGEYIKLYLAKETVEDPFEKNVSLSTLNPISVRAIVEDLTSAQAVWKMPGVKVAKVKDICVEARHRKLLELSSKIEIQGEMYHGWREFGKMQLRDQPGVGTKGYVRVYAYIKAV